MQPDGIVVPAPALDQHLGLAQRIAGLLVQGATEGVLFLLCRLPGHVGHYTNSPQARRFDKGAAAKKGRIMSRMPVAIDQHQMWRLTADRKTVRMRISPIKLAGQSKPLDIFVDLDAKSVGDVLHRLSDLRTQMLPAPTRN